LDVRALQQPTGSGRLAAAWYASTFSVDVNLGADGNTHQVALYLVDWDNQGRSERVDVYDAATGVRYATQTVSAFGGGEYLVFSVSGHVRFQLTNLAGPNAVLSGLFLSLSRRLARGSLGPQGRRAIGGCPRSVVCPRDLSAMSPATWKSETWPAQGPTAGERSPRR
jgi:hypothetical protein